jgi:hypothetical protein
MYRYPTAQLDAQADSDLYQEAQDCGATHYSSHTAVLQPFGFLLTK